MTQYSIRQTRRRRSREFRLLGLVPYLALTLGLCLPAAQAATLTVTNLNNDGSGSLRQAIIDANNQPGADTIKFKSGLSGTLAIVGTLEVTGVLDLVGPGTDVITVLGNQNTIFYVTREDATFTISGLTITNGRDGIQNRGTLTVNDCDISRNYASGIYNVYSNASLTLNDSLVSENNYDGIHNYYGTVSVNGSILSDNGSQGIETDHGTVTIEDSVVSGNKNRGIYNDRGILTVNNTTIADNSTSDDGAGIYNYAGNPLTITNTTFSGNEARSGCGGGLDIRYGTNNTLYNNTFSDNLARWGGGVCIQYETILSPINLTMTGNSATDLGGGIFIDDKTTLMIGNSLVVGNSTTAVGNTGTEIYNDNGTLSSKGYNLFGQNGTSGLTNANPAASDLILSGAVTTAIGPLADNGGPTQTHFPAKNSPAIDAGDKSLLPDDVKTDQRGEKRIQNNKIDIGAVEANSVKLFKLSVSRTGSGTVTSKPAGIDCGATCSANFESGKTVKLTATPADGWAFNGWDGVCKGAGVCEIKMNAAKSVIANFSRAVPDFVITSISLVPGAPVAKDTFNVKIKVKNQGAGAATGGTLSVWANQASARTCGAADDQSVSLGNLAAGASKTLTVKGLSAGAAGDKTLRVFVDSDCATQESDESNNQSTKAYTVRSDDLPDLVVTEIKLTPAAPSAPGVFVAAVTIENQGFQVADGGYLDLWADQPKTQVCGALGDGWAEIGRLAAGTSRTIKVDLRVLEKGTKTLRAFADSWCETDESKEGNNQYTLSYTVN